MNASIGPKCNEVKGGKTNLRRDFALGAGLAEHPGELASEMALLL